MSKMIILLIVGICLLVDFVTITTASSDYLIESDHPYANNFQLTWPAITESGATQVRIHFTKMDLQGGAQLWLLDNNDKSLTSYGGSYGAQKDDYWTDWYTGDTIKVKLKTAESGNAYGFKIDNIETRTDMALASTLPESYHPYANNFQYTWPAITRSGATQMRIHFTKMYVTGGAQLWLLDNNDKSLTSYGGSYGAQKDDYWTEWYTGDTIKVKLKTSGSRNEYGFKIDNVETRTDMALASTLPESYHPYANNFQYTWPAITRSGATQMRIHFTKMYVTGGAQLWLLDNNDKSLISYGGSYGAQKDDYWTEWYTGDTIKVKLKTSGSSNEYGFKIDNVETRTDQAYTPTEKYVSDTTTAETSSASPSATAPEQSSPALCMSDTTTAGTSSASPSATAPEQSSPALSMSDTTTAGTSSASPSATAPEQSSPALSMSDTTTDLTSSTSQCEFGQQIKFTARIDPMSQGTEKPLGTVTFMDRTISIGTGDVISGKATLTTSSLSVGSHPITAKYSGDSNFKSSISPAFKLMVLDTHPEPTTTEETNLPYISDNKPESKNSSAVTPTVQKEETSWFQDPLNNLFCVFLITVLGTIIAGIFLHH